MQICSPPEVRATRYGEKGSGMKRYERKKIEKTEMALSQVMFSKYNLPFKLFLLATHSQVRHLMFLKRALSRILIYVTLMQISPLKYHFDPA